MKNKKLRWIIPVVLIAVVGIGMIWYNTSVNMIKLDVEKVDTIKVRNGSTGEMLEITNREDITYLIEEWNNTKLSRQKISLGYAGYSFYVTLFDERGKELGGMNNFYINSNDVARKDPFFYDLQSGNLNHDYIEQLFNEVVE